MLEILFCLVVGITNGDTLKARCGEPENYSEINVRLIGMDAPEKGQDFGQRSKEVLSDLCYMKQAEVMVYNKYPYGQVVAEVSCDSINVNAYQVATGMAMVWPQLAGRHEYLYDFQDYAQENKLGIWSQPNPIPPWEFRKNAHEETQAIFDRFK